jgi:hypothetical protein
LTLLVQRKNGYTFDANDYTFHKKLLETASKATCMTLISGYDNELYTSLLTKQRGWTKTIIKTYTRAAKGKRLDRNEVLWKNDVFQIAEKSKKLPLVLTAGEVSLSKINPSRKFSPSRSVGYSKNM